MGSEDAPGERPALEKSDRPLKWRRIFSTRLVVIGAINEKKNRNVSLIHLAQQAHARLPSNKRHRGLRRAPPQRRTKDRDAAPQLAALSDNVHRRGARWPSQASILAKGESPNRARCHDRRRRDPLLPDSHHR